MLRTQDKRLFVSAGIRDIPRLGQETVTRLGTSGLPEYGSALTTGLERYFADVMASSPRAFYPLQDKPNCFPVDYSGNGLDCTTFASTPDWRQTGPMTGTFAIRTAGGESLSRSSVVSTVTNNFTMELLIDQQITSANDQICLYNGTGASNGWGIWVDSNGTFQYLAGGVAGGASSAAVIEAAGWKHIVVLRDAGTWKYYVNGAVDTANAGSSAPNTPSGTFSIGGGSSIQSAYAFVAIYETVLSADTIAGHYAATGL